MRITSEVMVDRSVDRLQSRLQRYERAQSELANGKRIIEPSDDPVGTRRAMSLRSAVGSHERNLDSISDAIGYLDAADSQLQSVTERLARARELATRAASNTNQSERAALAEEFEQIGQELVSIANARHQGRPLFAGYLDADAVDAAGDFHTGLDASEGIMRRISDSEKVRINVTANQWGTYAGGTENVFKLMDDIADDLRNDPTADFSARIGEIGRAHDSAADSLAEIGSTTNRVESARSRAEEQLQVTKTELSEVEDLDMAEGVMELQIQDTAYQATLKALSRALPPSLVSFLR